MLMWLLEEESSFVRVKGLLMNSLFIFRVDKWLSGIIYQHSGMMTLIEFTDMIFLIGSV